MKLRVAIKVLGAYYFESTSVHEKYGQLYKLVYTHRGSTLSKAQKRILRTTSRWEVGSEEDLYKTVNPPVKVIEP